MKWPRVQKRWSNNLSTSLNKRFSLPRTQLRHCKILHVRKLWKNFYIYCYFSKYQNKSRSKIIKKSSKPFFKNVYNVFMCVGDSKTNVLASLRNVLILLLTQERKLLEYFYWKDCFIDISIKPNELDEMRKTKRNFKTISCGSSWFKTGWRKNKNNFEYHFFIIYLNRECLYK